MSHDWNVAMSEDGSNLVLPELNTWVEVVDMPYQPVESYEPLYARRVPSPDTVWGWRWEFKDKKLVVITHWRPVEHERQDLNKLAERLEALERRVNASLADRVNEETPKIDPESVKPDCNGWYDAKLKPLAQWKTASQNKALITITATVEMLFCENSADPNPLRVIGHIDGDGRIRDTGGNQKPWRFNDITHWRYVTPLPEAFSESYEVIE